VRFRGLAERELRPYRAEDEPAALGLWARALPRWLVSAGAFRARATGAGQFVTVAGGALAGARWEPSGAWAWTRPRADVGSDYLTRLDRAARTSEEVGTAARLWNPRRSQNRTASSGKPQPHWSKIGDAHVCSLFARMPRYHPSAPGTGRQRIEVKSARNGSLNPRVRGSSPWRRTRPDLGFLLVWRFCCGGGMGRGWPGYGRRLWPPPSVRDSVPWAAPSVRQQARGADTAHRAAT
jgi:hypothetical protein